MQITQVSADDGKACAYLLNFLKSGRWEMSGEQAEQLMIAKRWLAGMANQMASELKQKPASEVPPPGGMRVKSMGSLGGAPKKSKKKG